MTVPDIQVIRRFSQESAKEYLAAPSPWTGELWLIAAHKKALQILAERTPATAEALRSGTLEAAEFRRVLEVISESGMTPLTLGNSHGWPYMLWLQHWAAAISGPASVMAIPSGASAPLDDASRDLKAWRNNKYFHPESWNKGWAAGLIPLREGKAAFALVSSAYMGPLEGAILADLEFLPFPGQKSGGWSVGSALFLAASSSTPHPEESKLLIRFLSSPGITEDLTRLTGKPFFSWDSTTGELPLVLASWADAALTPEYETARSRYGM